LEKGWEVSVLSGPASLDSQATGPPGFELHILRISYAQEMGVLRRCWSFFRFMLGAAIRAVLGKKPDVVIVSSPPLTAAFAGLVVRYVRGVPFVFRVADLWPDLPIQLGFVKSKLLAAILLRFEQLVYKAARGIAAASPGAGHAIIDKGIPARLVSVIPNCSDIDSFGNGADGGIFRERFGFEGKFICAHTGSMGFVNGLDAILDAALLLQDSRPDILVLLVGKGSEQSKLIARAEREGLVNVRFAKPIPKAEMPKCLAATDIGLMTVRDFKILEHNSATKFFDYLAAGKPVLLNYGGWQAEWLARYDAGVSVPPGDARAMADAIVRLASDRRLLEKMGRNARRLAEEQFEKKRHMARLEAVVRRAALGKRGRDIMVEPWPFGVGT